MHVPMRHKPFLVPRRGVPLLSPVLNISASLLAQVQKNGNRESSQPYPPQREECLFPPHASRQGYPEAEIVMSSWLAGLNKHWPARNRSLSTAQEKAVRETDRARSTGKGSVGEASLSPMLSSCSV